MSFDQALTGKGRWRDKSLRHQDLWVTMLIIRIRGASSLGTAANRL
jgi:hypothetical protein